MAPINQNSPGNTYEQLTLDPAYGPDFAKKLEAANNSPLYGQRIFVLHEEGVETSRALQSLADYFARRAALNVVPSALKNIFQAISQQVGLVTAFHASSGRRPQEAGFIEALNALCDTKEGEQTKAKMIVAEFDPVELRDETSLISQTRELARPLTSFMTAITRSLVVWEGSAYDLLSTVYGKIRTVAQADDLLMEGLSPTESYLYGAAKVAAQTNKDRSKLKETLQTEADKKAILNAGRQVRDGVAAQIKGLADELTASAPLPSPIAVPTTAEVAGPAAPGAHQVRKRSR